MKRKETPRSELRLVNCIAFSPDSLYMAVCTSDNIIRVFALDLELNSTTRITKYERGLTDKACRNPHYGVTSLALYYQLLTWLIIVPQIPDH